MSSWFSSAALGEKLNSLALGEKLNGLKDKVQSQVDNIDPDLIKKLTLQSDEFVSVRQQFGEEERRKETLRDSLSDILPWETRDKEMEILVDECKEVILGLSSNDDTFTGPFVLPGGLPSGGEEFGEENEEEDKDRKAARDLSSAEASSEKLSKLQPLPSLLADFDLDTHVGLIQRLLKVDPKLVESQARLSSGGERELVFWKNYFFHCAYTRYEAGLSIDEIWSNDPISSRPVAAEVESEGFNIVNNGDGEDEEVIFDSASSAVSVESGSNRKGGSLSETDIIVTNDAQPNVETAAQTSVSVGGASSSPSAPQINANPKLDVNVPSESAVESGGGVDYEFVASDGGDEDDGVMDELEAEIAAALGD